MLKFASNHKYRRFSLLAVGGGGGGGGGGAPPNQPKNLLIPTSPGKVLSPPNTYIHSLTKFWFLSGKGQPPTK